MLEGLHGQGEGDFLFAEVGMNAGGRDDLGEESGGGIEVVDGFPEQGARQLHAGAGVAFHPPESAGRGQQVARHDLLAGPLAALMKVHERRDNMELPPMGVGAGGGEIGQRQAAGILSAGVPEGGDGVGSAEVDGERHGGNFE